MKTNTQQYLKIIEQLVAGADHEIANLLMMIEGSSHILLSKSPSPTAKNMALDAISDKTQRIKEVMEELRSVLKPGDDEVLKDYYVKDLINKSVGLCRTRFKNHKIFFSINISDYSAIQCNETQITQALLAVLTSCHDSIIGQKDRWIKVSVSDLENELIIDIEDSGDKISDTDLENMFTDIKNKRGGMALMWAKEIIESHKGKISIINNNDHPLTSIIIPRIQKEDLFGQNQISQGIEIYDQKVSLVPLRKVS